MQTQAEVLTDPDTGEIPDRLEGESRLHYFNRHF